MPRVTFEDYDRLRQQGRDTLAVLAETLDQAADTVDFGDPEKTATQIRALARYLESMVPRFGVLADE